MTYLNSVIEAIGNTPMVRLHRLEKAFEVEGMLLAKLEYLNPGFSKKDRIALEMILHAEASGELKPGQPVVELTSGNTGTGLAIVCGATGHPFIACMSEGNSIERARMMRALGAEVILVPQQAGSTPGKVTGEDLNLVEDKTQEIVKKLGAFRANQFNLPSAVEAHRKHTAQEIWKQTDGKVDVFLDYIGTASTFIGTMKGLKDHNEAIRGYIVEPDTEPYYGKFEKAPGEHKIQGGGYGWELPLMEENLYEDVVAISSDEAMDGARALASKEGIFAGFSSGATLSSAVKLLRGREKGSAIVFPIADSGLKYLSTDLYPQW